MGKEFLRRQRWITQFFHVGNVSAGLDGKDESGRNLVSPEQECLWTGKMIEGIVDLDGAEMLDVEIQHLIVTDVFRIKRPSPVRVVPARGSDMHSFSHSPLLLLRHT